MIYLDLGREPDVLTRKRDEQLPIAVEAWNAWQASVADPTVAAADTNRRMDSFKSKLTGYRVVVDALHERQHGKCAYCERPTGKSGSPVEHIRPKNGVEEESTAAPGRDPERYWWLCWDWRNLVFACATCNCQANKGNRFPLADTSPRVPAPTAPASHPLPDACFDTSIEQRLFVHPRDDDPLEHLEWAPTNRDAPPSDWTFSVIRRSDQGAKTIEVLDLPAVIADIQSWLGVAVWPWVVEIRKAKEDRRWGEARACWTELCARVLGSPRVQFRGPTYWAMRHAFEKLGLSQLGCSPPPKPSVTHIHSPLTAQEPA